MRNIKKWWKCTKKSFLLNKMWTFDFVKQQFVLLLCPNMSLQQRCSVYFVPFCPWVTPRPAAGVRARWQQPYQSEIGTIWSSGWFPTMWSMKFKPVGGLRRKGVNRNDYGWIPRKFQWFRKIDISFLSDPTWEFRKKNFNQRTRKEGHNRAYSGS